MKKYFLSTLLAIAIATGSFAAEGKKAGSVLPNSFSSKVKSLCDVHWASSGKLVKATFIINNLRTEVLYTKDGELVETKEEISLEELPLATKRVFAKNYGGYTVKEAFRFEGMDESGYHISAENEKGEVYVKIADDGSISIQKD